MRPRKPALKKQQEQEQQPEQSPDLITSSTRKRAAPSQCLASPPCKRISWGKASGNTSLQPQEQAEEEERTPSSQSLLGTIFSPVLHLLKGLGGECSTTASDVSSKKEEQEATTEACSTVETSVVVEAEQTSAQVVYDDDDFFDPYLFIKKLPDLSLIVPPCRRLLLPRRTRRCPPITLVLDLDETLVHSTLDECQGADFSFPVNFNLQQHMVYVRRRPHLEMFMERVSQLFEIIVFTASQSIYAEQLLNILDPKRRLFRHRVYRDSCVFVAGNYLKDLTVLGRDLSKTVIVDNSPQAFGFQVDNGIPIESWFDNEADCELALLLPFLESLATVDDVRPIIAKTYNLRQKIEAAIEPPPRLQIVNTTQII